MQASRNNNNNGESILFEHSMSTPKIPFIGSKSNRKER
jgi:hypothetical protein